MPSRPMAKPDAEAESILVCRKRTHDDNEVVPGHLASEVWLRHGSGAVRIEGGVPRGLVPIAMYLVPIAVSTMSNLPAHIVIVGGGIIGVSTAYYLSRSPALPADTRITLVEGTAIAAGASGYAGGFLARAAHWHTPETEGGWGGRGTATCRGTS